jgi:hypothetical protein
MFGVWAQWRAAVAALWRALAVRLRNSVELAATQAWRSRAAFASFGAPEFRA